MRVSVLAAAVALLTVSLHGQQPPAPQRPESETQGFRFKSGVELINVTATVSDVNGRFVPGLRQEDFIVYEDDQPVTVTHFNAERVPVSLGIAAWGLVTGVAMVKSGLSVPLALMMTLTVFAGSVQLTAVPLMMAGSPAWVM